jgi:glycosyltransferase involved in cell wall biosynthesis
VVGDSGFYFDPNSAEDLKSVLENNLYDDDALNARRLRGRERAAGFSWDRCASETLTVYRSVLA